MFSFRLEDVPRIKELIALGKVCGCKVCMTCNQANYILMSLYEPNNVQVLAAVLDIPQEVFHNRGS